MPLLNRRAILAGAACLPATALPALAEPDPIFAAIEAHNRLSYEVYGAARQPGATDDQLDELYDLLWDRREAVFTTIPTTPAGIRALVDYVLEAGWLEDEDGYAKSLLENIVAATDQMASARPL